MHFKAFSVGSFASLTSSLSALVFAMSLVLGACNSTPYVCTNNTHCNGGNGGRCVVAPGAFTGACAEPTTGCSSGFRYSRSAPSAGTCVESITASDASTDVQDAFDEGISTDVNDDLQRDVPTDAISDVVMRDAPVPICTAIQVAPERAPELAPPLPDCGILILQPASQRLHTSRAVRFKVMLGAQTSAPFVEVLGLPQLPGAQPFRTAMAVVGGSNQWAVRHVEADERFYALRWRITATCPGSNPATPWSVLALPRPYVYESRPGVRECMMGQDCNSPQPAVAANVDLNLDGRADLVVSQPGHLIVRVTPSVPGPLLTTHFCLAAGSQLGRNVEAVGDLDGDGNSDFLLSNCARGAMSSDCTETAVAYGGGPLGISEIRALPFVGPPPFDPMSTPPQDRRESCLIGATLAAAGDINEDGYSDALIGGPCAVGGVINVVFGSPTRAPRVTRIETNDPTFRRVSGADGFASSLVSLGGGLVVALSHSAVRVLQLSTNLIVSEPFDSYVVNSTDHHLRWQGLTGTPFGPMADTGAVTHGNAGTGLLTFLRYDPGQRAPLVGGMSFGQSVDGLGAFVAGPIDLNNDGRGDSLCAGRNGSIALIEGGGPHAVERVTPVASRDTIRALASVGNVLDPLIDAFAVVLQENGLSRVQLCQRADGRSERATGVQTACNDAFFLPLNAPAAIAGR